MNPLQRSVYCQLLLASLVICIGPKAKSQTDAPYFLSAKASAGPSFPIGSFSKKSTDLNSLGKCSTGINFHFDVEATYKEKYTLGIGYDISDFNVLNSELDRKIAEANGFNEYDDNIALMDIQRVSMTASRRFQYKRVILQLKGDIGGTAVYYGYMNFFYVDDSNPKTVPLLKSYESKTDIVLTVVPEINLNYIFVQKTHLDLAFNLGINYCYMLPKIKVMESEQTSGSADYSEPVLFTTLEDPISMLNINFGVIMFFKKKLRNK